MKIVAIGDEYFVSGFQIAGVSDTLIVDAENANKTVEEVLISEDVAVAITNKSVYDMLSARLKDQVNTKVKPTFVILSHDVGAQDNLRMMIKRSLGIDLWK